ncbi:FAD-dependent oxidoreductase [Candidatus Saccharibacteria bacterium]|nr:FAD-dependent oxidoreductase [Candidatus Saccharibacteria bacterium]
MIQVSFEDTENVAENIKTFWFKTRRPVHYTPGQFTQLRLAHQNVDKRGDKRWFTLSSSPSESLLAITTKLSQPGSSFKRSLRQLQPGTELHLADPTGDFVLPKDASIPLIFVAGGIGITPMRSMIKWLTDMKEQRHITLLYAVNSRRELAFLPLLKHYCQPVIILSREVNRQEATLSVGLWFLKPDDKKPGG